MSEVGCSYSKRCKQRLLISPGSTIGPKGEFHSTICGKQQFRGNLVNNTLITFRIQIE